MLNNNNNNKNTCHHGATIDLNLVFFFTEFRRFSRSRRIPVGDFDGSRGWHLKKKKRKKKRKGGGPRGHNSRRQPKRVLYFYFFLFFFWPRSNIRLKRATRGRHEVFLLFLFFCSSFYHPHPHPPPTFVSSHVLCVEISSLDFFFCLFLLVFFSSKFDSGRHRLRFLFFSFLFLSFFFIFVTVVLRCRTCCYFIRYGTVFFSLGFTFDCQLWGSLLPSFYRVLGELFAGLLPSLNGNVNISFSILPIFVKIITTERLEFLAPSQSYVT